MQAPGYSVLVYCKLHSLINVKLSAAFDQLLIDSMGGCELPETIKKTFALTRRMCMRLSSREDTLKQLKH